MPRADAPCSSRGRYPLQALTLRTSAASLYLTCRAFCCGMSSAEVKGPDASPPPSPPDDAEALAAAGRASHERSSLAGPAAPTAKLGISPRPSSEKCSGKYPLALDDEAAAVSPSGVNLGWGRMLDSFELKPLYALPTLGLIGVTLVVGLSVSKIDILVDISGSVGATSIAFIAPSFMYFRLKRDTAPPLLPGVAVFVFFFGWFILISGLTFVGITGS